MTKSSDLLPHSAHWGAFFAKLEKSQLIVVPHPRDPDPNPIINNLPGALRHKARVKSPVVRRGWLERGPGPDSRRGKDEFVSVTWKEIIELLGNELNRVKNQYGPEAIFGGSYGWSSAGRFHHAQSQIHRFLNISCGGYVRSVNTYSAGCAEVMIPHIFGTYDKILRGNITWEQIAAHTEVVLSFGGMALKNSRVAGGGVSQHLERGAMRQAAERGCRFVCISPIRSDLPDEAKAEWMPVIPNTDAALMLGLAHTLFTEGLYDKKFLARYCDGWASFEVYLTGEKDGVVKNADWAAPICGITAQDIRALARSLPGKRVLVVVAHSLQRAEHGEQPVWLAAVLTAMLGQYGLPGAGYGYALGTLAHYGRRNNQIKSPSLFQGVNNVNSFIPVARITDMLLNPGKPFDYNGQRLIYPRIRLIYWAGGNPFHHHQDLQRLANAVATLDTFVIHESAWTASARHADIVLPATLSIEREDIGSSTTDPLMVAMHQIVEPYGEARDDYDIFCALSQHMGTLDVFSEGRTKKEWLRYLFNETQKELATRGLPAPEFDQFWQRGELVLPQACDDGGLMRAFREDPQGNPLPTPSGKIQITSPVVASFQYSDCPGYPGWLEPSEPPDELHPFYLISNQPATRLHSQLDFGGHSQAHKVRGREVCTMHPDAAAARGIKEGDIVRLFNQRGACLSVVRFTRNIMPVVIQIATGAWYDPVDDSKGGQLCVHGNPNILTRDIGTSRLAQGCTGQLTTVQIERYEGELPDIRAYDPPLS
ncbi:TPA: molybdopterin-dependent oxidoreductase [Enterobacter hormaechei subsp. steigerwaltii]|nr:molybdopterin-dependent oxidoreductase [Enterobacter hormaechei subsp. steigerwaltii]HAV1789080.1 molybdopterin-dependent oxidoreductase [Enterobacter hormaechei subsp. xiangfangensis]